MYLSSSSQKPNTFLNFLKSSPSSNFPKPLADSVHFGNAYERPEGLPLVKFYSNIPGSIERFHKVSEGILTGLFGKNILPLTLDHIYIATSSPADYDQCRQLIISRNHGVERIEHPNFKGRRLSVWELKSPWAFTDQSNVTQQVRYIELGEPKPGQPENNRIAHVAYQTAKIQPNPTIESLIDGRPKSIKTSEGTFSINSVRIDPYGSLKLITEVDGKPFEIEMRPEPIKETLPSEKQIKRDNATN